MAGSLSRQLLPAHTVPSVPSPAIFNLLLMGVPSHSTPNQNCISDLGQTIHWQVSTCTNSVKYIET